MPPKMFATDGSEKDHIVVYKLYAQKRPEKMNEDDSPFYLVVNNNLKAESLQVIERVIVEKYFRPSSVSNADQSFPQCLYNCNVRGHNYYPSR